MGEIRVVAQGGSGGGGTPSNPPVNPSTGGTPSGGGGRSVGLDDLLDKQRLTDEYLKLIRQQGAAFVPGSANARQIWNQMEQTSKKDVTQAVQDKYTQKRLDTTDKAERERQATADEANKRMNALFDRNAEKRNQIDERAKQMRVERLASVSKEHANDPYFKAQLDNEINSWKASELQRINKPEDEELANIKKERDTTFQKIDKTKDEELKAADNDEKIDLQAALRELTDVLKGVKEQVENDDEVSGGGYLSGLRDERNKLIQEREGAATEEEAREASKRISEIDKKIKKATGDGDEPTRSVFDRALAGTKGVQQIFSGLESGDMGSTIMGTGSAIAGFGGLSIGSALSVMGVAAVAAGIAKAIQGSGERYDKIGDLAALRPEGIHDRAGNTLSGNEFGYTKATLDAINNWKFHGYDASKLGMGNEDFAARASNTARARGTTSDWYNETYRQIALEKYYGLKSGELEGGSKFDRYGTNVTTAISRLITELEGLSKTAGYKVEGANSEDFSRVKEKYDFQQSVIQGYLGRTDKPNYDMANRAVVAMNAVQGITHDQRDASDYQVMQNMILNPKSDSVKALLQATVSEIMPEMKSTEGGYYSKYDSSRMDLIDRAIRNPENEGKIIQAVIQKISQMYGGTDTQAGYFAFKYVLEQIAPDRVDQYVNQLGSGNSAASQILTGAQTTWQKQNDKIADGNLDIKAIDASRFVSDVTETLKEISNELKSVVDFTTTGIND